MGIWLGIGVVIVGIFVILCSSGGKTSQERQLSAEEYAEQMDRAVREAVDETEECQNYISNELKKHPDYSQFWPNKQWLVAKNIDILGFPNLRWPPLDPTTKFVAFGQPVTLDISVVGEKVYFFPGENNIFVRENANNTNHIDYEKYYVMDISCKYPIKPLIVPLDDILYFCEVGKEETYTTIEGGGATLSKKGTAKGAIIGGLVGGQVGAGVGAVLGSGTGQTAPIKTSVHKNDTRRAKLFMKLNGENVCIDFTSNSANFEHLLQIMPEKNVEWVQKHQTEKQEQASTADELLKFKNLLDQGVITQEEFDKKKTQLLGN